MLEMTT